MLTWAIQSYEDARSEILQRSAAPGRVQLIRGDAGVGKTTLAGEVTSQLAADGFTVLPIVGIHELSSVPLGAMTPILALASTKPELTIAERLQRLLSVVAAPAGGQRYVLAVDDGPLLDEMSASAVYQLVRVHGIRCVMTARTTQAIAGPLARLLVEGLVDECEIVGLSEEQAGRAVRQALGRKVEPTSLGRLVHLAGGNPLFLRELTFAAHERQAMRSTSDGLEIDVRQLPTYLRTSISDRFDGLDADERAVIEMLAVASPLPLSTLSGDVVERLRAALLVNVNETGVLLAHPLYAEVVLAGLSGPSAERSRLAAARLLETEGATEATRYRVLCLRLDSSEQLVADDLTWAAQHANWLGDRAMSLRFAVAAVAVNPTARTLSRQATALSMLQRWDEAELSFENAATLAVSDDDRVHVAAAHGSYLAFTRGRARAAVALGSTVIDVIEDDSYRQELQTHLGKWSIPAGEASASTSGSDQQRAVTTVDEALLLATRAIFAGDAAAATAAIAAGTPHIEAGRGLTPHARQLFEFIHIFVLLYSGQLDQARDLATAQRSDRFSDLSATFDYASGLLELYAGNIDRTLELARSAAEGLQSHDIAGLRMPALALFAAANARLGNVAEALDQLGGLEADTYLHASVIAQGAEARAWVLAHQSRYDEAAEIVAAAAATLVARESWGVVGSTAYVAVRLGRAQVGAELLQTAVQNSPSPLLSAMNHHAVASLQSDPVALVEAADMLASTGQFGAAVDAADEAVALYRASNAGEQARLAARRAAEYAALSSDFRLRRPSDSSVTLTARERTVADAAAGRESSREIAARLGLSVRTVETHLANVYRKLGVRRRADLRNEL
jgi:DNA-binding CsgD family transcriptional regulator